MSVCKAADKTRTAATDGRRELLRRVEPRATLSPLADSLLRFEELSEAWPKGREQLRLRKCFGRVEGMESSDLPILGP